MESTGTLANRSTAVLGVATAVAAVAVWRALALGLLYAKEAPDGDALLVGTLLAASGITFLVCGLVVFLRRSDTASLLFAGFCVCSGLHWGGPLDLPAGPLRVGLILFYVLVSGVLGATFLLHFALLFPERSRLAHSKRVTRGLYGPVVAAAALALGYLVSPPQSGLRATAEMLFMVLHDIVSNLFAVAALALIASHLFRSGASRSRKMYVGLMVIGMLVAWLPYMVVSAVGARNTDPWNLTVVALPLSFAIALLGIDRVPDSGKSD